MQTDTTETPANGTVSNIDGTERVYYNGYWVRYYAPPPDTPREKKALIESLVRRTFHNTERGINTPGEKLETALEAFELESDPDRKRVIGAMLAGAYFNRAIDILNVIAGFVEDGVLVRDDNELMIECGDNLKKAQEFSKMVKHYSGEEGIDELWGEPLKAFTMKMADYYESRYIKITECMRDIDRISAHMIRVFGDDPMFPGVTERIRAHAEAAKFEVETAKGDPLIFKVWPEFISTAETIEGIQPLLSQGTGDRARLRARTGRRLLRRGKDVITYVAGARVRMPKTTREYLEACDAFAAGEVDVG